MESDDRNVATNREREGMIYGTYEEMKGSVLIDLLQYLHEIVLPSCV
jgi:hypothetical protein